MRPELRMLFSVVLSMLMLCSCSPPKQSFLTVQLCLGGGQNFAEFMDTMRAVAKAKNLKFIDGSSETKFDLETINVRKPNQTDPVINIGIDDKDGWNLMMGGNLGLPGYQVALAFGEGGKPSEGHALAEEVVRRLKMRWKVLTVPNGEGAFPLKSCGK